VQSVGWKYLGYRRGTLLAVYIGFIVMVVVSIVSIVANEVMALCLALFIYFSCKQQWIILETGGEDSLFGYDFSQGYTSLERENVQAAPVKPRLSWWRRWLQKRAARRLQREMEQREGMTALTDEERRFMKRVSDRYRNRPRP